MKSAKKVMLVLLAVLIASTMLCTMAFAAEGEAFDWKNIDAAVDPLVNLFANFDAEAALTTNAGTAITVGFIVLAVFGLIELFAGQKLIRLEVFFIGLVGGAYGATELMKIEFINNLVGDVQIAQYIIMAVIGLLVAWLLCSFVRIGIFAGVVAGVYFVGQSMIAELLNTTLNLGLDDTVTMIITVVVGLVLGFIVLALLKFMLRIVTALVGAGLLAYVAGGFIVDLIPGFQYTTVILAAVLFIVGFIVQLKTAKKN